MEWGFSLDSVDIGSGTVDLGSPSSGLFRQPHAMDPGVSEGCFGAPVHNFGHCSWRREDPCCMAELTGQPPRLFPIGV